MSEPKAKITTMTVDEDPIASSSSIAVTLNLFPFDCIEIFQDGILPEDGETCMYLTRRQAVLVARSILKMLGEE